MVFASRRSLQLSSEGRCQTYTQIIYNETKLQRISPCIFSPISGDDFIVLDIFSSYIFWKIRWDAAKNMVGFHIKFDTVLMLKSVLSNYGFMSNLKNYNKLFHGENSKIVYT